MTVLTKTKKPNKRPRCDNPTNSGRQCVFRAIEYVGGCWCCSRHVDKARANAVNPFKVIEKART